MSILSIASKSGIASYGAFSLIAPHHQRDTTNLSTSARLQAASRKRNESIKTDSSTISGLQTKATTDVSTKKADDIVSGLLNDVLGTVSKLDAIDKQLAKTSDPKAQAALQTEASALAAKYNKTVSGGGLQRVADFLSNAYKNIDNSAGDSSQFSNDQAIAQFVSQGNKSAVQQLTTEVKNLSQSRIRVDTRVHVDQIGVDGNGVVNENNVVKTSDGVGGLKEGITSSLTLLSSANSGRANKNKSKVGDNTISGLKETLQEKPKLTTSQVAYASAGLLNITEVYKTETFSNREDDRNNLLAIA